MLVRHYYRICGSGPRELDANLARAFGQGLSQEFDHARGNASYESLAGPHGLRFADGQPPLVGVNAESLKELLVSHLQNGDPDNDQEVWVGGVRVGYRIGSRSLIHAIISETDVDSIVNDCNKAVEEIASVLLDPDVPKITAIRMAQDRLTRLADAYEARVTENLAMVRSESVTESEGTDSINPVARLIARLTNP